MLELHLVAILVIALAAISALDLWFACGVVASRCVWRNAPRAKLGPRRDDIDDDQPER